MKEKHNYTYTFNVLDVIKSYIDVKKAGGSFTAKCPFHNENDASLTISPDKNIWKCFGCGLGGDAVKFVSLKENISYNDAYNKLCIKYGYSVNNPIIKKDKPYKKLYEINDFVGKAFVQTLTKSKSGLPILDYLHQRMIDDNTIKEFGIGYSMLGKNGESLYLEMAKEMNFLESDVKIAGLLNSKNSDLFQERVVLPIKNEFGDIQGFVGRCVKENLVRYLNTPETPIFKKSNVLFNLDKAVGEIRKLNEVIITEGSFDVIALHQSGIKNVVCSLGTSLTFNQLNKLKEFTNNIVLLFDGDSAGIKATIKAYKLCKKMGLNFKAILLPNKHDPSSFMVERGKEELFNFINNNKVLFFDYYINNFFKIKRSVEKTLIFQNKFFELLEEEDSLTQKIFLEKWALYNNINPKLIKKDFINYINSKMSSKEKTENIFLELNSVILKEYNKKSDFEKILKYLNKEFLPEYERKFLNSIFKYFKINETLNVNKFISSNNEWYNFITSFPLEHRELKEVLKDIYQLALEQI